MDLFQRSHADLLQKYMELQRQNVSPEALSQRLTAVAEEIIRDHDTASLVAGRAQLTEEEKRSFRVSVRGLMGGGALVPLLERDDVENIHILGHDNVVLSLATGERIAGPPLAGSEEELVMLIRHLAATAGHTSRRFDTASPILDLRLASGHRLFAVTAVAERTSVVIRRHRMLNSSLERLMEGGTVTPEIIAVLRAAVRPPAPANMLVVGGTGAGKTTLLRSLLAEVPQSELIVTIEDTLELHLRDSGLHIRTLALETRTTNTEGTGEITMYDLCKAALRMSPDRVIVGEVRGGEVMQLLQSMGIGNDGSLGTIHAGNTRAAINKMLIYAQRSPDAPTPDSVMREIAEVMHLLVYIKKLPDGRRAVTSIREITGFEDGAVATSEVFAPGPDGVGVYVKPFKPDGEALARLVAAGFDPDVLGEPYRRSAVVSDSDRGAPAPAPAAAPTPPPPAPAPGTRPPPRPQRQQAPLLEPRTATADAAASPSTTLGRSADRPQRRPPAPAPTPRASHRPRRHRRPLLRPRRAPPAPARAPAPGAAAQMPNGLGLPPLDDDPDLSEPPPLWTAASAG